MRAVSQPLHLSAVLLIAWLSPPAVRRRALLRHCLPPPLPACHRLQPPSTALHRSTALALATLPSTALYCLPPPFTVVLLLRSQVYPSVCSCSGDTAVDADGNAILPADEPAAESLARSRRQMHLGSGTTGSLTSRSFLLNDMWMLKSEQYKADQELDVGQGAPGPTYRENHGVPLAKPGNTVVLLHPRLPSLGSSVGTQRGCRQSNSTRNAPGSAARNVHE